MTPARSRTSTRVRAALAGGLVFGIAAGLTVASWTDAEYASSTLTASRFDIETSVNGAAYSNAATVAIPVSGVYPGQTGARYVSVLVRTTTSSVAGTVRLSHAAVAGPTGLTAALRYRAVLATGTCDSTAFGGAATYLVGGSTYASSIPVSTALAATGPVALAAGSGAGMGVCFEFNLASTGVSQTLAGTSTEGLVFTFTGTSS